MPKVEARFQIHNRVVSAPQPVRIMLGLALVIALLTGQSASAQSAPRPEAFIKWRQSAYQVIAWNSGRIKAALAGEYSPIEVQSAANALAAVAGAGLPALFPAGTADGKGWRETTARDEVFSDAAKFRALTDEFAREANTLARLAKEGERSSVNAQFLKVAQACKACHEKFRQTD